MTLTTTLNTQKARILTAIDNLDTLATTLNKQKQVLAGALDTLPQAVKILADEKDQFVTLLESLDRLTPSRCTMVNESPRPTSSSALKSLQPVPPSSPAGDA